MIVWTSTLDDSWNDLAVKPVFLPLVHQLVRYLAHYEQPPSWFTVGQVLDLTRRARRRAATASSSRRRASASRTAAGEGMPTDGVLELNEQGFYEVRDDGRRRPDGLKRLPSTSIRPSRT